MLVPDSQACGNQFSSTSPIPATVMARRTARVRALQEAVARAQQASDALLVANPWEDWQGGLNLMKDVQRGNAQVSAVQANTTGPQLPGMPPAGSSSSLLDWLKKRLAGARSGNARQQVKGWDSRFVKGPGGRFVTWPPAGPGANSRRLANERFGNCGAVDCTADVVECQQEAADVVPSDGIVQAGSSPVGVPQPPANPALRTEQPVNIVVSPPAEYSPCMTPRTGNICLDLKRGAVLASDVSPDVLYRCSQLGYAGVAPSPCGAGRGAVSVSPAELAAVPPYSAGMGEWSASIAQPGAVPSDCKTGAVSTAAAAGFPWWLWALAGVAVFAVASGGGRSSAR